MANKYKERLSDRYDFNGGIVLSEDKLERIRNEVVDNLANDPTMTYSAQQSGNSLTFAIRDYDGQDIIEVYQTSGYKTYVFKSRSKKQKIESHDY